MKKFWLLLVFILQLFILTSCDLKSDESKLRDMVNSLIESLDNNDETKLKDLFSSYAISNVSDLDAQIDDLLSYYNGKMISLKKWGYFKSNDKSFGEEKTSFGASYDITTDKDMYKLAVSLYTRNDFEPELIGIHSIYIIKASDYPYGDVSYNGDGLWTLGCNIGKIEVRDENQEII